ncbi:hypothetical protein ABVT39_017299 [Epinephelus coioides]
MIECCAVLCCAEGVLVTIAREIKRVRVFAIMADEARDGNTEQLAICVRYVNEVQTLTRKMDEQTELLKSFDRRIEANTTATRENKEEIGMLKKKVSDLQKENNQLKNACADQARYKRRWNLRLTGLPEKEGEDTRETVIGILRRVVPLSVEWLRQSVDTVHRLGRKDNPAASNGAHRAIIIQFGMRTVRDEVWKRSRDARVCSKMHIRFREDFSKEDREARNKLWPLVQDARRRGKRAFLKEGYALIENKRVDPE